MAKRPTQAQRWLDAGHRYDDLALWQELCAFLEARGLVPTTELPSYLAPLVFRDPENAYERWLRENHLLPVGHLTGNCEREGNGWWVRADWRERLAVMRDPTPDALLAWWRGLEPVMHRTCLRRVEGPLSAFYDPTVPGHHIRTVYGASYECTRCRGRSWSDDPRGILHRWKRQGDKADCPLLRLHLQVREAERAAQTNRLALLLTSQLEEIADQFLNWGRTSDSRFWDALADVGWRDSLESAEQAHLNFAAFHIAQTCAVWIDPMPQSIQEYAHYLRGEGAWPHSGAQAALQQRIRDAYAGVADQLDELWR